MTANEPPLPYRLNVGAALFAPDGRVLVARRRDRPVAEGGWQLPQGGIDRGEDPSEAIFRELAEEIGTANAEIMGEHEEWLQYDLPAEMLGHVFKGRYRGQRQKWYALRFLGEDADIQLDLDPHPEFDDWKWVELSEIPALAVAFKRTIYERLAADFARFVTILRSVP